MLIKRIAGICFSLSFVLAIVLFTNIGQSIISDKVAKYLFLVFGGLALILNLFSFRKSKHDDGFNLFYWIGSVITFIGLAFLIYGSSIFIFVIIIGLFITGISFLLPKGLLNKENQDNELLDK